MDEIQRMVSYKSGTGVTVYEKLQYNKKADNWYIVGDCGTDKRIVQSMIDLHNTKVIAY